MRDYDDDRFYDGEDGGYHKLHLKGAKKKFKGHHSRRGRGEGEIWGEMMNQEENSFTPSTPILSATPAPVVSRPSPSYKFVPGPNSHQVKSSIIDFDRVANIEKVENEHEGRQTYGIKFIFTGSKQSFRIVWFNQNFRERDSVYNKEFGFWKTLKK